MKNLYYKIKLKYLHFKIKRGNKKFTNASNKFIENEELLKEKLVHLNKSIEEFNSKIKPKDDNNLFYE